MNDLVILDAIDFAIKAHNGQVRKYSGIPYVHHPINVMKRLIHAGYSKQTMLIAALLHDVIEDTEYGYDDIYAHFGTDVANLVVELTNTSKDTIGANRAKRKQMDKDRFKTVSYEAKIIKMFDIISNVEDMIRDDAKFAKIYIAEKIDFVEVLDSLPATEYAFICDYLDESLKRVYLFTKM